ncbi:efflux RND transporter periplasmic adaptor subunit [Aestuariibacter salexigens]|uniref:efflux RND transporter periplasmic adaptor subunit n=1 Tax=Aestuariibacter salexigens TaxID=226010 RepID=UPI000406176A|nr:HlyD family efflux transporter periplasmic adaptor subunit [Aestuariibacter salexigens]
MNKAILQRILFWLVILGALVVGLLVAFWPRPKLVDVTTVQQRMLQIVVTEEGDTRIHDVYTLSAPITGHLRRIDYDVGDQVVAGETRIAEIEPVDAAFLDSRSEAQARAQLQAATSARALAEETVKQAEAELEFADAELSRIQELRVQGTVSQRELDNAQRNFKTSRATLATAHAALQMKNFEMQQVQALLQSPTQNRPQAGQCECMTVIAPISGTVLNIHTRSEGVVSAGTPLIDIGDPRDVELVVELLSVDAVKVSPGMEVIIDNWGGDGTLKGQVTRVEPFGFTKYSALGIEEQRVNVIIDIVSPYEHWQRLGHGYQVDASIILWQQDEVLSVPITALFRQGKEWMLFVVEENRARLQPVTLGKKSERYAQILTGVSAGDVIVEYPSSQLTDEDRVVIRQP